MTDRSRRIEYAGSVHGEEEIAAVVEVLRGPPTALRIGRNVKQMERLVAELFAKRRGVMVNSGSSALYLAVELIGAEPGGEVRCPCRPAPLVRAGLVPVFVDVSPRTFQIDTAAIEAAVGPRTRAILAPNLVGNCPDWDVVREIADRHDLLVIEDSCDCLGATLRGTPTGTRSDLSLTSFAMSHIITAAGTGGMLCLDDEQLLDRAVMLRRWGRRSERKLFGTLKGSGERFFSELPDGTEYDDLFIFDEVGWNFEPSELSAAFGVVQLEKLSENLAARRRNAGLLDEIFGRRPDVFELPSLTPGVETAWHMYPLVVRPESGVRRAAFHRHMEGNGIDTRMVWTGNVTRQPAFASVPHRVADPGLPEADRVMDHGVVLPCNHGMNDDDLAYVGEVVDRFFD